MKKQEVNNIIDIMFDSKTGKVVSIPYVLEDYSYNGRIRDWKGKKRKNQIIYHAYARLKARKKSYFPLSVKAIKRVQECSNFLEFKVFPNGEKKLYRTNLCKNRFCPLCSWRTSLRVARDNMLILSTYNDLYPDYRLLFLTLTVKNCNLNRIKSTIARMNEALRRLRRRKRYKAAIIGEIKTIEITINHDTNMAHPHMHLVLAVDDKYFDRGCNYYISHAEWSAMWADCLKEKEFVYTNIQALQKNEINKAANEISKYIAKDTDYICYTLDNDNNIESRYIVDEEKTDEILFYLVQQTYGLRLLSYTGVLKEIKQNLKLKDENEYNMDDLIHIDDKDEDNCDESLIVVYRWGYGCSDYLYYNYYVNKDNKG